jgi:hypothetical protein
MLGSQAAHRRHVLSVRRRAIYLGTVLSLMLQSLKQFSHSDAYLITMWLMEFLVLLLIAWEVIAAIRRHHVMRKKLKRLFTAMEDGQKLRALAPVRTGYEETMTWVESVKAWTDGTAMLLQGYSQSAALFFLHQDDLSVKLNPPSGVTRVGDYMQLVRRLNNLRSIMENSEVYF